jgi:hypothetical protein
MFTKAWVLTTDVSTEIFDILAGALQVDTFAPTLFVTFVDYAL